MVNYQYPLSASTSSSLSASEFGLDSTTKPTLRERRNIRFWINLPPSEYNHTPPNDITHNPLYYSSSSDSLESGSQPDSELDYSKSTDITIPPKYRSLRDRRGVNLRVLTSFATPAPPSPTLMHGALIPAKGNLQPTIGNLPRRRKRAI